MGSVYCNHVLPETDPGPVSAALPTGSSPPCEATVQPTQTNASGQLSWSLQLQPAGFTLPPLCFRGRGKDAAAALPVAVRGRHVLSEHDLILSVVINFDYDYDYLESALFSQQ